MKTWPRPKTKLLKLVEIVPDMYPDLFFSGMSWKPLEITEKWVHRPAFFKDSFRTSSRGFQRVAEGDVIKWHTLRIQMHLFSNWSCDYIQDVIWFCNATYTQKGRWPYLCLLFSYYTPTYPYNEPNQMFIYIVINLVQPGKV